ncbi:MAG TPA: hypothetical protein VJY62_14685 [Bacteroidia bacterium]|nr:hypothetical protein [Bacteroidia bacterium]
MQVVEYADDIQIKRNLPAGRQVKKRMALFGNQRVELPRPYRTVRSGG